jgi:membrane protease subunit HflC
MRAERERIANQYRSEGDAEAIKIRAEADAERERITAEARREYETIRGEADATATRIYGEAYGADPEFYRFLRILESYETGIDADTVLILPTEAEYFRLLVSPDLPTGLPTIPPATSPTPVPGPEHLTTDGHAADVSSTGSR